MAEEKKDGLLIGAILVIGLVGYAIWKSQQPVAAHYHGTFQVMGEMPPSPEYMRGDAETPEYSDSTDDWGGTLYREEGPMARMAGPIRGPGQNYPFFTGGTIINPGVLPRVPTYHLQ